MSKKEGVKSAGRPATAASISAGVNQSPRSTSAGGSVKGPSWSRRYTRMNSHPVSRHGLSLNSSSGAGNDPGRRPSSSLNSRGTVSA